MSKKGHQYTFSKKVDMSMEKAKNSLREEADKPMSQNKRRATSTFVQKLYRDEDELNELKVLAGDGNFDSDVEDKEDAQASIKAKRDSKRTQKTDGRMKVTTTAKVGKLKLEKGSVALFAVNEVYPNQYAIVNHTRNVKGYINLKDVDFNLSVGQLVVAYVQALGTSSYLTESSGHQNRKLQLSLEPKLLNRGITSESVTTGMLLQGSIESLETKGYMIDLGLKDQSKAFVKFPKNSEKRLTEKSLVQVLVASKTSKLIRCSLLTNASVPGVEEEDDSKHQGVQMVKTDMASVTPHTLKPGFAVSGKVAKLYENGLEITFLGGMTGTVFADHLSKANASKYKLGEKVQALVISQDIASKATSLSLLPNLLKMQPNETSSAVGQVYTDVKVEKKVYGNSYLLRLPGSPPVHGLLHKSNIPKPDELLSDEDDNEETKDLSSDDAKKRAKQQKKKQANKAAGVDKDNLLDIGQIVSEVRVKEYNYFDGMPLLSMMPSVVKSESLSYKTLAVGAFHTGTIESVVADGSQKRVILKIGDFVKGSLALEHMADHPLKVVPPKFTQLGKEIKVRVFSVNQRQVELTKKDSLMKESVPLYTSLSDLKAGMALYGVVVGSTEHGLVIKSFSGLKGLLKHDDVKEFGAKKLKTNLLKPGHFVKSYVMFVKKGSGIALTLSKKKAKKNEQIEQEIDTNESLAAKYMPSSDDFESLKSTYGSLLKNKNIKMNDVANFKVCESRGSYHIVKSMNAKKPQVAILPKCLATSFGIARPFEEKEFSFEAVVIATKSLSDGSQDDDEEAGESIAVVCAKPELISLKDEFKYTESNSSLVALVENVSSKHGVTLRYSSGLTKLVALRDISNADKVASNYSVGQIVRAALTKVGKMSLKRTVIDAVDRLAGRKDQNALISAFDSLQAQQESEIKIGQKIDGAKVNLVKDYGLILQIESGDSQQLTGLIVNEQKLDSDKTFKAGESKVDCVVLDIDHEKKIVDCSERLYAVEESKKVPRKQRKDDETTWQKAVVELNKEKYLIVTLKENRQKIGVCLLQNLTADSQASYDKIKTGDEIDVKIVKSVHGSKGRFILTQPRVQAVQSQSSDSYAQASSFEIGQKVTGTLKSIKGMSAFYQIGMRGKVPIIGRLHAIETASKNEFSQIKPGDRTDVKILQQITDDGKLMIELTRRSEHMESETLDEGLCKLFSLDKLTKNQEVEGVITYVAPANIVTKVTNPVQVQISPSLRSQLLFSDIIDPKAVLQKTSSSIASYIAQTYKMGKRLTLIHNNGKLRVKSDDESSAVQSYEKGKLAVVRFVKAIKGYGVTVQLDEKTFGAIELCELTDDITSNVCLEAQKTGIFLARVIGQDKKGRLRLSARESILDEQMWRAIQPEGTSSNFLKLDGRRQENGNMRNKVMKYTSALAFKQGELTVGYVTNISKAGCFIQVASNVTMRASLNDLSDDQDYDFQSQLPIGRVVIARITKAANGNTRFDCSLRKSLVVYGVHQVARNELKPSTKVPCIILATSADNVSFGQVKGSYHKLKIKDTPEGATAGQICQVEISKVAQDKIVAQFVEWVDTSDQSSEQAKQERHCAKIFSSVLEECQADIAAARALKNSGQTEEQQEPDIEQLVMNKRKQTQLEEQIRDLQQLDADGNDAQMSDDDEIAVNSDDSDADEIKRLQAIEQKENEYESSDQEEKEDENMSEEGESEQDDDEDAIPEADSSEENDEGKADASSEEGDKKSKNKSGKKALRAQIEMEKTIRAKEAQMRSKDGAAPTSVNDFERLLVADYDQSYLWIQYMAFMLENLDAEAARRVAERAVNKISMTAEDDKLNLWIAFMNLESKFGTEKQLQDVVKRALDVNDRRKVYLQLISIYRANGKVDYVEDIYKKLCKKYFESLEIWSGYIDFLFDMRGKDGDFTDPKTILQRSLQALPKSNHVNIISKFGMLEYKNNNPEHARTMFEGIVSNCPKRMDIWSIYMDMEVKYGGGKANQAQARHLFERCLSLNEISSKPKKMKLVFRKYMEFENALGNQNKLAELRVRVEKYLEQAFKTEEDGSSSSENEDGAGEVADKKQKKKDSKTKPSVDDQEMEESQEEGSGSGDEEMSDEDDDQEGSSDE